MSQLAKKLDSLEGRSSGPRTYLPLIGGGGDGLVFVAGPPAWLEVEGSTYRLWHDGARLVYAADVARDGLSRLNMQRLERLFGDDEWDRMGLPRPDEDES